MPVSKDSNHKTSNGGSTMFQTSEVKFKRGRKKHRGGKRK